MSAQPLAAFQQAASLWSALLSDPVTVYIDIAYRNDGANFVLGSAGSSYALATYSTVRNQLLADRSSAADQAATASLGAGATFAFWGSNLDGSHRYDADTNPCPASGPSAPCATNNFGIAMTTANARALGLDPGTSATSPDAGIAFNAYYGNYFDFDRSDGIGAGRYDFVAVAAHEIGHALGFVSGVDAIDECIAFAMCGLDNLYGAEDYVVYSPLDLFRYGAPGQRDLRVGRPTYLSLDAGQTAIEGFSSGAYTGDGYQASHFVLGPPNLMHPSGFFGLQIDPTLQDIVAMDAIGWDVVPIPEPGTYALMLLGVGVVAGAARRRRGRPVATRVARG